MRGKLAFLLVACLLVVTPTFSQSGRGVIVETSYFGIESIGPLNPLLCSDEDCRRITRLLFPTLFDTDPVTGQVIDATPGSYGLVADAAPPTEPIHTLRLRDDLFWSDGRPVTAYDVFYSYWALVRMANADYLLNGQAAMRPLDAFTLEMALYPPDCGSYRGINFSIAPAHVFDPGFAETAASFEGADGLIPWLAQWSEVYPSARFTGLRSHPFNREPTVTAGAFVFDSRLPSEEIRLRSADGTQAYVIRQLPPNLIELDAFLAGASNLLDNIPINRRADLLTTPDIQIERLPSNQWTFIALNLADPRVPFGALNERGEPLNQGVHPIFGDLRVRRALQMGIDVQTIIDTALLGEGVPIASSLPPSSWAYNPDLTPIPYNPVEAARLLENAGWKDVNRDGMRECVGCQHAAEGTTLSFSMEVIDDERLGIAATLVQRQLRQIGVSVQISPSGAAWPSPQVFEQRFDAVMGRWFENSDNDQSALWTRRADQPGYGLNFTSYYNPRVEQLLDDALNMPQCRLEDRAPLYREVQVILQQDQPYLWLYSPTEMVAARGILNLSPLPGELMWNIRDWVVIP